MLALVVLSWIANSSQGRMVGDYVSTSFADNEAHAVFTAARRLAADHAMWSAAIPAIGSGTAPTPDVALGPVKEPRRPPAKMIELPTAN